MTRNPTSCWDADRHLPAIEDKAHGWRMNAGFTLEQIAVMTTDLRIPEDRRVLYSLRFLGGPRPGEAANARWRDLDRLKKPLWRLTLEQSFNSPMRQEKSTKMHATLTFPIRPVVQKLLLAWEAEGWEKFMGRKPTSDDFMFPRVDGKQRLVSGTYEQFLVDLAAVGFPAQPQYESRSTFRNLALSAGANEFHLNLITHPKPKRASDHYTRLEMQWPKMCEAVLAIDPAAWAGTPAAVTQDEVTVEVTGEGTTNDKPPTTLTIVGGELEREKGFEPSTLALARRCSTAELFPQNPVSRGGFIGSAPLECQEPWATPGPPCTRVCMALKESRTDNRADQGEKASEMSRGHVSTTFTSASTAKARKSAPGRSRLGVCTVGAVAPPGCNARMDSRGRAGTRPA